MEYLNGIVCQHKIRMQLGLEAGSHESPAARRRYAIKALDRCHNGFFFLGIGNLDAFE